MTVSGFQQQLSQEIIKKAQEGDLLALEKIYLTFVDASYTLVFRICENQALAQDIVQDAFMKIFKKVNSFNSHGSFSGWIRRIVVNETINRVKSERLLRLVSDNQITEFNDSNLFGTEWVLACSDLESLLKKLSITSRTVLILHEIEGYKHQEISAMFGKSVSFSKVALSRAYNDLMKIALNQEKS